MPDTPDLDTFDLPGLLALWAERYPDEIHLPSDDASYFSVLTSEDMYDFGWSIDLQARYVLEGHARTCIHRAGFATVRLRVYDNDWTYAYASNGHVGHEAQGPSLAVALVRLRLSLPQPTDR